ncbi:MAG: hypothetical protein IJR66_01830 [Clostridia bacterium]|nr:hypothetical protein [Clostridia bacterium]MBQ9513708.1 hypothetical protein [Clostridia bacterium]
MKLTKKQQEIDVMKWEKSQKMGADACGSFDFCACCDKDKENPCDNAFTAFNKKAKPVSKKPATKTVAKKSTAVAKKVPAKKSK